MKKIFKSKKAQSEFVTIVSIIILASAILFSNSSIINNSISYSKNVIEKTAEIEIYANTSISLSIEQDIIKALLLLDNETILPEQEIEFYLNEDLVALQITNSQGYAYSNLNETSPGTYFLKAEFQGNSSLYLNPSSIEKQIQATEQNGSIEITIIENETIEIETNITTNITILNETEKNITISNETFLTIFTDKKIYVQNETINIFGEILINGTKVNTIINLNISFNNTSVHSTNINLINGSYSYSLLANFEKEGEYLVKAAAENLSAETTFYLTLNESIPNTENMICKEFEDDVLWTSGFTHSKKSSIKYQTWIPGTNCTEAGGKNCFLQNISIDSRIIYVSPYDEEINGRSYVQISNPDNSICNNPENGVYSKYLAYESVKGLEGQRRGWYCGEDKEEVGFAGSTPKCGVKLNVNFNDNIKCYGIKAYASQSMIIDVFKVKYKWCWDKSYGDNPNEIKKRIKRND